MDKIAYVNGSFVPMADAKVSVLDRGFLFADGIYEVAAVLEGKLIDNASHLARLQRSVGEIALAEERQLRVEERPFTVEEALKAKEAFITSASVFVQAVVSIDGKIVAHGKPGPMTDRLREIYVDFARATAV